MIADASEHRPRVLAFCVLVLCLVGLLVWAGTIGPNPAMNDFPGNGEVGPNPEAYVGERVGIGGVVVATQPVVIEMEYGLDGRHEITLTNLDESVEVGQDVSAFGTLTDEQTLAVERALVRSPWERWYMFVVSFLGGVWVLARLVRDWRVDADRLALVPRGEYDA